MAFGIDDAIGAGLKILDKFIPDPAQKAKAESELRASLLAWDQGQLKVNEAEAMHRSIFVAGWRPFLGWTFGVAFAFQLVLYPIVAWASMTFFQIVLPEPPKLDNIMQEIVLGMLGIGGLRTFEKIKNVAK